VTVASYRLCGTLADYVVLPDEENPREGWIMHLAVCGPRETPAFGDRVLVGDTDYTVAHWTKVPFADAPDECRNGCQPGQGIFELRLQPA
jgi:hypothetical protein